MHIHALQFSVSDSRFEECLGTTLGHALEQALGLGTIAVQVVIFGKIKVSFTPLFFVVAGLC